MYLPLTKQNGVLTVRDALHRLNVNRGPDGLTMSPDPSSQELARYEEAVIPERLLSWLIDLRLLRSVPLPYLVPDEALLPPESIRFFHVDLTWMDRLIEGALSAASVGTVDSIFGCIEMALIRERLDAELRDIAKEQADAIEESGGKAAAWSVIGSGMTGMTGMTGMLIRSELVRRWPKMIVRAYSQVRDDQGPESSVERLPVFRSEPISRDLFIAIFGGTPAMVHVREPNVGLRFGVERNSTGYVVDGRDSDTGKPTQQLTVTVDDGNRIDVSREPFAVGSLKGFTPRQIALHLEQRPYVQEFKRSAKFGEERGSVEPPAIMYFRRGRYARLGRKP